MSHKRLLPFLLTLILLIVTVGCSGNKFKINIDTTGKPLIVEDREKSSKPFSVMINGEKVGLEVEVNKKDYACIICEAIQNRDRSIIALSVRSWPIMININGARLPNIMTFDSQKHILLFRGKKLIYSRDMSKDVFIFKGWNERGQLEIAAMSGNFAINEWGREIQITN